MTETPKGKAVFTDTHDSVEVTPKTAEMEERRVYIENLIALVPDLPKPERGALGVVHAQKCTAEAYYWKWGREGARTIRIDLWATGKAVCFYEDRPHHRDWSVKTPKFTVTLFDVYNADITTMLVWFAAGDAPVMADLESSDKRAYFWREPFQYIADKE